MSIGVHIADYLDRYSVYLEHWGVAAVGVGIFGETFLVAGFFVTGFAMLITAGLLAAQGHISTPAVLGAAFAGGVIGDQAAFALGWFLGDKLLRRYDKALRRLRYAVTHEGGFILLWFHFFGPMRMVMPYIAGSVRFPLARWLIFGTLGLAAWLGFGFGLGYVAMGPLQHLGDTGYYVIFALVVAMVVYTVWKIGKLLFGRESAADMLGAEASQAAEAAARGEALEERVHRPRAVPPTP